MNLIWRIGRPPESRGLNLLWRTEKSTLWEMFRTLFKIQLPPTPNSEPISGILVCWYFLVLTVSLVVDVTLYQTCARFWNGVKMSCTHFWDLLTVDLSLSLQNECAYFPRTSSIKGRSYWKSSKETMQAQTKSWKNSGTFFSSCIHIGMIKHSSKKVYDFEKVFSFCEYVVCEKKHEFVSVGLWSFFRGLIVKSKTIGITQSCFPKKRNDKIDISVVVLERQTFRFRNKRTGNSETL